MTGLRRLAWVCLAVPVWGCGETTRASSPHDNVGDAAGGATSGGGQPCTGAEPTPDPAYHWANWSMPHPPASGLPNPALYDTSQPGVAVDTVTGLMWPRAASPIEDDLSFESALSYCAELEVAGYCDWRLPTRIELVSLVDFTRAGPAIDQEVFSDFAAPEQRVGWGFFTSSSNESSEWRIFFLDGTSVSIQRGEAVVGARARCVREHIDRAPPESRYLVEGNAPADIVTDWGTGLTWQRTPSTETYSFSEAQAHCSALALAGAGWRLPSMKELQTIVDESRSNPALDPEIFPDFPESDLPDVYFRTSSLSADCSDCAWLMRPDGSVFETGVDVSLEVRHYVRCVRSAVDP